MAAEGYDVSPAPPSGDAGPPAPSGDAGLPTPPSFITAVKVGSGAKMAAFCEAVQAASPVGSYVRPVPGACAHACVRVCVPRATMMNARKCHGTHTGHTHTGHTRGGTHTRGTHTGHTHCAHAGHASIYKHTHTHTHTHGTHTHTVHTAHTHSHTGVTAGYGDPVIFGDGTFIDGSTAELSADGPLRPPFAVYCQGGTHWTHWALALKAVVPALRAARD